MDLSDPMIYQLVNSNHVPEEQVLSTEASYFFCSFCSGAWPCKYRKQIAAHDYWERQERKAQSEEQR